MSGTRLPDPEVLARIGEHFAAGFFEHPDSSPMRRWSLAVRRFFEHRFLPPWRGEPLYPCGIGHDATGGVILCPSYSFTWSYQDVEVDRRLREARLDEVDTLEALRGEMQALDRTFDDIRTPHVVGGRGYTHSIPNYGRVIREGLDRHAERVRDGLVAATRRSDAATVDFYLGLQDVLAGIASWLGRIRGMLATAAAPDPAADRLRGRLHEAYHRVPEAAARSFFEAVVAYNVVFYLDGCDNPGRVDMELAPLYEADLHRGATSHAEAVALLGAFWGNVDANDGWSAGIGGCTPEGSANYTDLTLACLEAARGRRRPNLQLHVRRDMPQRVWDEAFATLATGCGHPSLYNDEAFTRALLDAGLDLRAEDLAWRNGGGCTETMIHGRSNVGSLDAGINLPLVLDQALAAVLPGAESFDTVLDRFLAGMRDAVAEIVREVNADQEKKARQRPQPLRSLLVDDCIERGAEFNAGGARYNWSVVNVAGLADVVDSLAALREVVFERREIAPAAMRDLLVSDFSGSDAARQRLARCPRYGNDDPRADDLAASISTLVFREFLRHRAWRGGRFLPSCIMFVTYADAGVPVGALPDGRRAGEPLADSAGPHQGRDTRGPTAMLRSVTRLAHALAPGTLVVNLRLLPRMFATAESRGKLQDLVRTYFDLGGMQLQVTVVDQEVLRDAMAHPERHGDLVVRIGGYSEYFNRLGPDLQATVLQRVEHGIG
jgi:pyruvate-formate lyase